MLNFSGGTYKNPDVMVDYWIDLVKKIRAFSDAKIAIEFAPPSDLEKIAALKNAGADVAIMNLEVANDELRKKICPGKSKISYEHYYKAFEKAVSVFGWGQVSSVLIAGIQPKEDIMAECEKMAKIGVFPTVMPIRPLDNAPVDISIRCKTQDLIEIATHLSGLLVKYNLDFKNRKAARNAAAAPSKTIVIANNFKRIIKTHLRFYCRYNCHIDNCADFFAFLSRFCTFLCVILTQI